MKKMNYWSMLTIIIVAMLSIGFASCSSDDDEEESGGGRGDVALVGKWYSVHNNYTIGRMFHSDGKCYYGEWGKGDAERWGNDGVGRWSASQNYLTITWTDEGDTEVEQFTYTISNEGKTLTLTRQGGGSTETYSKQ